MGPPCPGRASAAGSEPAHVTASACGSRPRFGVGVASTCSVGQGSCGPCDPRGLWICSPGSEQVSPLWRAWDWQVALHTQAGPKAFASRACVQRGRGPVATQPGWAVARSRVWLGQPQTVASGGFAPRPGGSSEIGRRRGTRRSSSEERKAAGGLGSGERVCQIKIETF